LEVPRETRAAYAAKRLAGQGSMLSETG